MTYDRDTLEALLKSAEECFDKGNAEQGVGYLQRAYSLKPDKRIKDLIDTLGKGLVSTPQQAPAPQDTSILEKDPLEILLELKRQDEEKILTREPKQDNIYTKIIKEVIPGVGEFVKHKITKGWRDGQRFSEIEEGAFLAQCGCILKSKDELGSICRISTCGILPCSKHSMQCYHCNLIICHDHSRILDGKPYCPAHETIGMLEEKGLDPIASQEKIYHLKLDQIRRIAQYTEDYINTNPSVFKKWSWIRSAKKDQMDIVNTSFGLSSHHEGLLKDEIKSIERRLKSITPEDLKQLPPHKED